jgi:hypothetical protein
MRRRVRGAIFAAQADGRLGSFGSAILAAGGRSRPGGAGFRGDPLARALLLVWRRCGLSGGYGSAEFMQGVGA